MKIAYRDVPEVFPSLVGKSDTEFNAFINLHWPGNRPPESDVMKGFMDITDTPPSYECSETSTVKSDILILPVSSQDESSTTGTAAITEEFAEILNIPLPEASNYLLV